MPEKPIDPGDANSLREISFGPAPVDPDDAKSYYARIAEAKKKSPSLSDLKGKTPVGGMERPSMPLLVNGPSGGNSGLSPDGGVAVRPPGSPVLSPETVEQMEAMLRANKLAQAASAEQQVATDKVAEEEKRKAAVEDLFSDLNFSNMSETEKLLNNKKRREDIESRCEPMDFEDLLMKDEVSQAVPIMPGKFVVVFRSMRPEDSLFIKQFLAKEPSPSDTYSFEKLLLCQLVCTVVSINGKELPDYRTGPDLTPDDKLFQIKLKMLTRKSAYIVADLSLNYTWFDIRVRKLIVPEKLGNG